MSDRDLMLAQLADMFEEQGDPRAVQLRALASADRRIYWDLTRTLADSVAARMAPTLDRLGIHGLSRNMIWDDGLRPGGYVE